MTHIKLRAGLAALALFAAACGSGSGGGSTRGVRSITITPASPGPASLAKGTALQLVATASFSDGTVGDVTAAARWTSSAAPVAVGDAADKGLARGIDVGGATVRAELLGETGELAVTVTGALLAAVEVTPASPTLPKGLSRQFAATGVFTDGTTQDLTQEVAWSSSDTSRATVSNAAGSKGLAATFAVGAVTVRADHAASGKGGQVALTVSAAELTSFAVTAPPNLPVPFTAQLAAVATYTDGTLADVSASAIWSSSSPALEVGAAGLATAKGPAGPATVTAAFSGRIATASVGVTVESLASIAVSPPAPSLPNGLSISLAATGTFSGGSTLDVTAAAAWASSAPAVAAVSNAAASRGRVTGVSLGSASISAAIGAVSGATTVTVTNAVVQAIAVTPASPTVFVGQGRQLVATATLSDGSTLAITEEVLWSSSAPAVAQVSNAAGTRGLAVALAAGASTVTATHAATGAAGSTILSAVAAGVSSMAVDCGGVPAGFSVPQVPLEFTLPCQARATFADATIRVVTADAAWSSSAPGTATVSNVAPTKGLVTGAGAGGGEAEISASFGGVSVSARVGVVADPLAAVTVVPPGGQPDMLVGLPNAFTALGTFGAVQLDVTEHAVFGSTPAVPVAGNVFTPSAAATGIVVTANVRGTVGSVTVDALVPANARLFVAPPAQTLRVGEAVPSVATYSFNPDPAFTAFVRTEVVTAAAAWSSSNPGVVVVEAAPGGGKQVRAVGLGAATVTAAFGGLTAQAAFTVAPPVQLAGFSVAPSPVVGGNATAAQLTLSAVAADAAAVAITTAPAGILTPRGACNLAFGSIHSSCPLDAAPVASPVNVTVTATYLGVARSTLVTVTPATLVGVSVSPALLDAGAQGTVTVTFDGVPASNVNVALASSAPGTMPLPGQVQVSDAKEASVTFTAGAPGAATVTATLGAASFQDQVLVNPQAGVGMVTALDCVDPALGETRLCTVTIVPDPLLETTVQVASADPAKVSVSPPSIAIAPTVTTGTFAITGLAETPLAGTVRVTATSNGRTEIWDVFVGAVVPTPD